MSRIAMFVPVLGSPTETFISKQINYFSQGHELTVFCKRSVAEPSADYEVIELPYGVLSNASGLVASRLFKAGRCGWNAPRSARRIVAQELAGNDFDVALFQFLDQWLDLMTLTTDAGVRTVLHGHGYDHSTCLHFLGQSASVLNRADAIAAVSREAIRDLTSVGVSPSIIRYAPYGVELDLKPGEQRRKEVLVVGRMVPKKAPEVIAAIWTAVSHQHPDWNLVWIGDGPEMESVKAQLADSARRDSYDLRGLQPPDLVLGAMKTASVFLQHSVTDVRSKDKEGLPLAILEAMARGLPVVATRHAGIPDAIQSDKNGVLVDEFDADGAATAVNNLIISPEARARIGKAAKATVGTHFSLGTHLGRLAEILLPTGSSRQ